MSKLLLKGIDGAVMVHLNVAKSSSVLRDMLMFAQPHRPDDRQDSSVDAQGNVEIWTQLPILQAILEKVCKWLEYSTQRPPFEQTSIESYRKQKLSNPCVFGPGIILDYSAFEWSLFDVPTLDVFAIALAADFLDIDALKSLALMHAGFRVGCRPINEICQILELPPEQNRNLKSSRFTRDPEDLLFANVWDRGA